MSVEVHHGDSREVLTTLAECSIDSVVTDPPYALVSIVKRFANSDPARERYAMNNGNRYASRGFMGQKWDVGDAAHDPEFWRLVLRVLRPGGHVVAFAGTRTYHRLACAIEDAGFEIRDMLQFLYGAGFPKSHDVGKKLDAKKERCSCDSQMRRMRSDVDTADPFSSGEEQDLLAGMRRQIDFSEQDRGGPQAENSLHSMRQACERPATEQTAKASEGLLQLFMPGESTCGSSQTVCSEWEGQDPARKRNEGASKSGMEGRRDIPQSQRELRVGEIYSLSAGSDLNGAAGRICDGASAGNGADGRAAIATDGMRASFGSSAPQQSADEFRTVAVQSQSQDSGAWPLCDRCCKPIIPDGLGTALKPACEPIVLARKPLSEKSIAANVVVHGTGAINVDGCRVQGGDAINGRVRHGGGVPGAATSYELPDYRAPMPAGRWPANVIHDGSDEVVAGFPDSDSTRSEVTSEPGGVYGNGAGLPSHTGIYGFDDSGSAARYFYTAKADETDRVASRHPTIKPVDLMQYLCRLITPPGGTILDPFAGSGTTGEAAIREGFSAILIEREAEYIADIKRRMELAQAGPDEKQRAIIKAKGKLETVDALPLFGGPLE